MRKSIAWTLRAITIVAILATSCLSVAAPQASRVAVKAPIAIGAIQMGAEHLIAPRDEVIVQGLANDGVININSTQEEIAAAVEDYYQAFAKKSSTWISPEMQQRALARENAEINGPAATDAIQPITATVFAVAVDFGGTDTITYNANGPADTCVTVTETVTGPLNGDIPHPGPRDNNTVWYTPTLTADPAFYSKMVFGYEGVGRVRMDLTDPRDGQPGIDLTGITMQDYYDHVAGPGNVRIAGDIYPQWVTVDHAEGYYGAPSCEYESHDGGAGHSPADLVADAVAVISTTNPTYFTDTAADAFWPKYDADKDGVIDTFWVIHAGMGQEAGGGAQGDLAIWAHSSDVRYYIREPLKVYEGDPATTADDIVVGPYTMQPENLDMGVLAEEFGHNFFGLPDMYTTDAENSIGFWGIMASGAWGGYLGGSAPVGMPLWFRMIAWCGTGYCNWHMPMAYRAYNDPDNDLIIGQLEMTPAGFSKGVRVNLPPIHEELDNPVGGGKAIYTGKGIDGATFALERTIDVPASGKHVLQFTSKWSIEENWDYGYIQVNGTNLPDMDEILTNIDPNNQNEGNALTGEGFGLLKFDLSAYAGTTITFTLVYKTDAAATWDGWWVDDLMIDSVMVDDFEDLSAWTQTGDVEWQVVPSVHNYTNYYLLELRGETKYDSMARTAYSTSYYDEDEWEVDRVPYNIPAVLVYYRNTKYSSTYAIDPGLTDPPSLGPKYQLLIVDMNPLPLRLAPARSYLNSRVSSYDAGLTMNDAEAFTLTHVNGIDDPAGPFNFDSKPAVKDFMDSQGYYPGFYAGAPCPGSICFANTYGSAVIPAWGPYSTRVTDFSGDNPATDLYGLDLSQFGLGNHWLGSGNPADDAVQLGVNVRLNFIEQFAQVKAPDIATSQYASISFYNYDVKVENVPELSTSRVSGLDATYTVTYTQQIVNYGQDPAVGTWMQFELDPALTPVSITADPATMGTTDLATLKWTANQPLQPGDGVVVTVVATGSNAAAGQAPAMSKWLESTVTAYDGRQTVMSFLYTAITSFKTFLSDVPVMR
jgi:immune inhibitor A